jgi:threonine dehydratase
MHADGPRTPVFGQAPFALARQRRAVVLPVSEAAAVEAMRVLHSRRTFLVEPSGAGPRGAPIVAVLVGGNMDQSTLCALLAASAA